jgi:hypothetical protein
MVITLAEYGSTVTDAVPAAVEFVIDVPMPLDPGMSFLSCRAGVSVRSGELVRNEHVR